MFAESRSNEPKVNLLSVRQKVPNLGLDSEQDVTRILSHRQLKISDWEFLLCRVVIFSWQLSTTRQFGLLDAQIAKLAKIFGCSLLFWLSLFGYTTKAVAQSFEPLTPEPVNPEQPKPLPPSSSPLDESLNAPPVPESVLDVPGTIVVKKFQFAGSTVFSQAKLAQAIAPFVGKPISFAQLVQAANEITQLYVRQGYITSGAYVPEQNLASGAVNIQIVEGSLAEVEVNLVKGRLNERYIRDRIINKTGTPLNINQLQEALQLLQLDPLIQNLDAELAAGVTPGTNSLSVSVTGADTFSVLARLNNNRNPSVGTFDRGIELREASLLGIGDQLYFAYNNTQGSNEYQGGYTIPINTSNGSLQFDFRLANNEIVEPPLDEVDLDINSRNYNLTWRQPVLRKATPEVSQELALSLTASRRESDTTVFDVPESFSPGTNSQGEIRTSALSFSQEWLQRRRQQVISLRSQFNLGLNAFDATINDTEPDSQFFSWRGQFSYLQLLSNPRGNPAVGSTILLRSQLQLAADPLIPTEQFSLGGANTVRGYRQDVLLTDNGFSAAMELRLPIARLAKINTSVQFSPFIDFGTGWNTDGEETEFSTLIGTGFGLLVQTEERLSARIDWGIPLINQDSDGDTLQEDGVYLQLEYEVF